MAEFVYHTIIPIFGLSAMFLMGLFIGFGIMIGAFVNELHPILRIIAFIAGIFYLIFVFGCAIDIIKVI